VSAHSRAAFAPEDVADARRGHPDPARSDLSAWAAAARWELLDRRLPSGFGAVVPAWPEHVFNVARGVLAGDVVATVLHRLYEVALDGEGLAMDGPFHDVVSAGAWAWTGAWGNDRRTEPFARRAVWVPTTSGAARVPQAALLPSLRLRRADRLPAAHARDLADVGLGGFRLAGETGREIDEVVAAWLDGEAGTTLRALPYPFVEVVVEAGHVALVRNGYAAPGEIDALVDALAALAGGLRTACASLARPASVATALPPPEWAHPDAVPVGGVDVLDGAWWGAYRELAAERGMALEDPAAFHRAFPDQPVPGRAQGVLRGAVAGVPGEVRLAWFADGPAPVDGRVRAALLLPAPPGAVAHSAPGGTLVEETGMWVEVAGEVTACWTDVPLSGTLDADRVVAAAVATLRSAGLRAGRRAGPAPS